MTMNHSFCMNLLQLVTVYSFVKSEGRMNEWMNELQRMNEWITERRKRRRRKGEEEERKEGAGCWSLWHCEVDWNATCRLSKERRRERERRKRRRRKRSPPGGGPTMLPFFFFFFFLSTTISRPRGNSNIFGYKPWMWDLLTWLDNRGIERCAFLIWWESVKNRPRYSCRRTATCKSTKTFVRLNNSNFRDSEWIFKRNTPLKPHFPVLFNDVKTLGTFYTSFSSYFKLKWPSPSVAE